MNRVINVLLLFFSFPALGFSIIVGMDLSMDLFKIAYTGSELPYRANIFLVFAAILGLLVVRRIARRWTGIFMTRQVSKFSWSSPIGKERKQNVRLFLVIEGIVALAFAISCWNLTNESWAIVSVYLLMAIEQFIFTFFAHKWFRIGITKNALVLADRETKVLYYSGLRKVDLHQQTVYFEYIKELQLFFPKNAIPDENFPQFVKELRKILPEDKVFFTEKFKL